MRSSVVVLALLAACEPPAMRVICHNANCVEPQDPDRDDTLPALHESLALGEIIDGIEIDLLVHEGRCLFAHDAGEARTAIPFADAVAIVADHLRTRAEGTAFSVDIEIKPTPTLDVAVDCALAGYATLATVTESWAVDVDVAFGAYDPATLRAVNARRPPASTFVRPKLALGRGVPRPLLDDNHSFSELDGVPLDIISLHPGWVTDTQLRAIRSLDVEIAAWFLDFTRETLDGVERIRPVSITTGQARTVRAWLDDSAR